MEKLEELYSLIPEGMYSSMEQFQLDLEQEGLESIFELIPEGMYADLEQFTDDFVELKKKDDSQFSSQEEVMESDTEVVEEPGTSVPSPPETPDQPEVITEDVVEETQMPIETPEPVVEDTASYIDLDIDNDLTEEEIAAATPGEKSTALERTFGKNEFTDFFGDMYRAGSQGQGQAGLVDNSLEIFGKGKTASDEDIQEFITAHNVMTSSGPSAEMKDFDRVFEQSGGGIFGFLKGLIESPTVAPQLFVSSISAMLNPASLAAAGATTGGFALSGAGAGPLGAAAGAITSIPFAMGAAGATLETGLSFAEFLNEELEEKGLKFTKEDIRKVLNDPEAMSRIRVKSAGRGAIIGIVDRYAAGLGGKLVGGMAKAGASVGKRILTAAAVEAAGGSTGEAAARLAVGQDMDIKEIGFEGIAGTSTTPVTYAYGTLVAKPVYKINNKGTMGAVDRATMVEMINTPDDKAFAAMDIEIVNDPELKAIAEARKTKLVQESAIITQLKEAGITDETAIAELTALEKEKQALQGNTTRAGKKKLSEIDAKIDAIMDQEVTEEVEVTEDELATQDSDAVKRETYETINDDGNKVTVEVTTAKDGSRILRYKDAEGDTFQTETLAKDNDITNEKIIELNVAEEGADITNIETIEGFENIANKKAVAKRKQELKNKQDAIQESSTESVDVQVQTEDGRAVGDGDAQTTITEESVQEEQTDIDTPTQEEIDIESRDLESFLNDNDVVTEETEVTTNEIVDETPGQIVNDNFTVTEKTTTENDGHYNSDVFAQENPNTTVDQHENKIINLATKAVKAITKILPDTKVVVHRSQEAYNKYADVKNTRGTFDPGTNTIHINMPLANNKTIAHEVFHAVLYNKYGTDIKIAEVTDRMVKAVKRKVKDKKLIKQLDDFVAKYDNFQNEEYLSELVGILADNYPSLAAPEKSIVRKWFEKVAKMLKIEVAIDTDADVLDLLNTISKKVKEGTEIATEDVTQLDAFEGGQVVENPASALQKNQVGDFEVTYTQQESVADMINAGLITEPKDISFIEDSEVTITAPDDMLAGEIKYKGKVIFEGEGGVFFVTKFGDVWASGKKGTANTIANSLNKQLKNNNGKAYLVLTKGTDAKLVSSASGVTSTLAILNTMLDNNLIASSVFRSAVSSAVKKAGGVIDLRQSAKNLKTDIANYFSDPTTTTFEKRGFIVKDIVGEIAKTLDKPSQQAIAKFLGGDIKRSVTKGETKFGSQSLVDLIARIAAEKLTKGLNVGDVYAVIEVNNEVEVKKDSHPSYPFHISLKDGGKPILHLLKNRQPGGEVLIQKSGKPYAVRNVSVVEGKVKKSTDKVTDTDVITQEDVKILYPKQRQQRSFDFTQAEVDKALNSDTKSVEVIAKGLKPRQGEKVGVRLNLNVLKNKGVPIQTVHQGQVGDNYKKVNGISGFFKGTAINYAPAVTLKDVYLNAHQEGVYKIKEGYTHKTPIASVDGLYQDVSLADTNFDGVEIRFNPMRGGLFVTAEGNRPVRSVEEATIVGHRVYGRGEIEYFTESNKPKEFVPDSKWLSKNKKRTEKAPKQRQQKVVFNVEKQRVYKDDASGVTFLTKGYGGNFINIPRKAITIKDISGLSAAQKPLVEVTMERDVYDKQDTARQIVDGKEKMVNELQTIRGFKKVRLIKDTPQKSTFDQVRSLAEQSGIKPNNFLPANLSNPQALNRKLKELGYSLATYGSPTKPYGYGILKPDGKLFRISQQRQQVADVLKKDMDAVEIITIARANNFRGPAIKDYLVRVKKMKVKDVVALLKVPVDIFSNIPEAFTNIKEGMNEGVKLYTDIIEKSKKWQKKNKATDAETFDKAVEFLEESKVFKNQADPKRKAFSTLQKEMIVGMQKSLGVRPMKNTNLKLRALRQSLKDTKRGAKELKAVQSKLRNFIRRSLPAKLYTKGEITTLISDVTNATEANIDNLIQKVIDKITTIQVADLETTIDKLLNDQYEKIESGREKGKKISVDVNDRLKALKKDMVTDSMVADDVVKRNLELNQEFNEITNKSEQLSEGDLSRLIDIKILINLNNATLMENTDVNKVQSLNEAAQLLTEVVGRGKELFKEQLKKDHDRYVKNKETVYEAVTGNKVDMSDPEQVDKAKKTKAKRAARNRKRETDGLFKKAMRSIDLALTSFFKASESLSGLMNIIDTLPGDLIGGKVRKLVYSKFNESLRVYKARMKGNRQNIEAKLQEVFGKKWKSEVTKMRKIIDWSETKGIWIDQKEVADAQAKYDADPTKQNEKALNNIKDENRVIMSESQILYQYQQFQDPANLPSFVNEQNDLYRGDPKRILESLMEEVDPKNKEIANWLVEEFYPSLYEHYNKTYKSIYRTNLPWNDKYAGRIYREANIPNPLDLLGTDIKSNNQVSAASTKVRRANTKPITNMDMMDVMLTYITDMEWFASHAEAVRDVNKMFDDPLISQAIEDNNGEGTLLLIKSSIEKIARRGINNAARGKFMNAINNLFISARLGANPTIFLKQLTSFITYANDIGFVNYTKYAAKNKTEAIKVYKEIWNNSVYVQDRASERIQSVIESYNSMGNLEFNTSDNFIVKLMMAPVKYGDLGAIFLGGSPNYSYYKAEFQKKNPTATEQQAIDHAIRKFEDDTKNTQQSADLQDKDFYQTGDPILRAFNMFLTTPKQYLRKEFGAMRNLYRKLKSLDIKSLKGFKESAKNIDNVGQGTLVQNIRQLAMYHVVMPMFFQFVALGFPDLGDLDDEEQEDLLRAAIIGNFNALFVAGDVIAMLADAAQNKPWAGTTKSLAPLNVITEIVKLNERIEKTKDPKEKAELTQKLILRVTELASTPTPYRFPLVNIAKYAKNLSELGEGGSEKDFLRLFNYGDYYINKDQRKKSSKLSRQEMKEYFPDLYEQEMEMDREMRELEEELELEF